MLKDRPKQCIIYLRLQLNWKVPDLATRYNWVLFLLWGPNHSTRLPVTIGSNIYSQSTVMKIWWVRLSPQYAQYPGFPLLQRLGDAYRWLPKNLFVSTGTEKCWFCKFYAVVGHFVLNISLRWLLIENPST